MDIDIGFVAITAVTLACIYGTLAIGVSITWSSLGLINMSYGFTFATSGYGAWLVSEYISSSGPVVILGGILTGALVGVLVCAVAFIPIHDKPNFTVRGLIASLALSLIGTQALLYFFGPQSKTLPPLFGDWELEMGEVVLTADKGGAILTSILMLALALWWMRSSRRGLEIRAMMMNPHAASLVGIGVRRTGFYVMALTGGLAGLASVLLSQTYFVSPFSGVTPLIKGLSVALCGGLGSVGGAMIAAVMIGINEALTADILGGQYILITQFLLIILVLIIRPRGIAGILDKQREA
ncbi:branched-chain amino acid ABC transporter permease [Methylobacillus flagellatus]|uniref:branched-chain amino acid ABC transporter permease n=1 Tax=Methylobacillus flagellatus TaxID=405 RepID=UPI002853E9A6|nr:branched-chain amino acid ABC transporter permease [Methylobacillus flagellatus]MDR5172876.1 branched-chain amino acid ABC transporter permease [Methylobacillus flagellatus]